jgi:hypothetical protein
MVDWDVCSYYGEFQIKQLSYSLQITFITQSAVAELIVLVGQRLDSQCVLSCLDKVKDTREIT